MTSFEPSPSPEQRWNLIAELFGSALEKPVADRDAYLEAVCAGDAEARREVSAMLEAHESGTPLFLEDERQRRPWDASLPTHDLAPGTRIGPWRVERLVAQGGMGEVYRGDRVDGAYRQTVAIKVLRPGYRTAETVRRFRVEREALARLVHPAIAAILDGGTLEDGRPYLVLQYVEGVPITEYCEARRLAPGDRLRLFVRVARVVEFAHSRLVIHRDLKPSNILIEADGSPRLLDFGIARMLDPSLDASLLRPTRPEGRLLTPEHAAPEQLRGEPCDTRTDVYGLGILLFQLLTGRTPFPAASRTVLELERTILETPPPLPSGVAGAPAIRRQLRGDLDRITQMALRKEPDRRYSSAAQFADDLERYLAGQPVRAQADRMGYRARKFFGRNRALVLGGAALAVLLLGFGIAASVQARRIARERDRAEGERAAAADMVQILTGLFERANPRKVPGGDTVRVAALLDQAERQIESLSGAPERQATLLRTVGQMHLARGQYARAEALLRRSVELQETIHGPNDLEAARSYHELTTVVHLFRGPEASRPMFDSSVAWFRRLGEVAGPDLRGALVDLATVTPAAQERQRLLAEAVELERRLPGLDSMAIAERLHAQAVDLLDRGRPAEAAALFQATLDIVSARLGPEHADRQTVTNNLATALAEAGEFTRAESLQRDGLARAMRSSTPADGQAGAEERLALTLTNLGRFEEAERLERGALTLYREGLAQDHPLVGSALRNLAIIVGMRRREREGLVLLDSAIAQARAEGGGSIGEAAYRTGQRVPMLLRLGRVAEAGHDAAVADSVIRASLPEGHPRRSDTIRWVAMAAYARRDFASAVAAAGALVELQEGLTTGNDRFAGQATCLLGAALAAQRRRAEARPLLEQGCPILDAWGMGDPLIKVWGQAALKEVRAR
jgi:serine/threonine-protein kinase